MHAPVMEPILHLGYTSINLPVRQMMAVQQSPSITGTGGGLQQLQVIRSARQSILLTLPVYISATGIRGLMLAGNVLC